MMQGDVSFTFLDRIQEIEWNIRDGRWQSALALALTLPDICGGIAYPEEVKKYRDGRMMLDKYGKPSRNTGNQYIRWFDEYAAAYFKKDEADELPYINGERCWQLRCEYLHQNKGFVNMEETEEIHFHLGLNCGSSICRFDQEIEDDKNIRLDIQQMCLRLCLAAMEYYDAFQEEKDFSLYNTPVIDFVEWKRGQEQQKGAVVILTGNVVLGEGLRIALENVWQEVYAFTAASDATRRMRKRKAALWLVEDVFFQRKEQPWLAEGEKVICLKNAYTSVSIQSMKKGEVRLQEIDVIELPCGLDVLREKVQDVLKKER